MTITDKNMNKIVIISNYFNLMLKNQSTENNSRKSLYYLSGKIEFSFWRTPNNFYRL